MPDRFFYLLALLVMLAMPGCAQEQSGGLANGDFAQVRNGRPVGWSISEAAAAKGSIEVEGGVLILAPNALNTPSDAPLGVGQAIDATAFRGQRLQVSARLSGEGNAVAVVGVAAIDTSGEVDRFLVLRAGPGDETEQLQTDGEPLTESASTIIVFASVEGTSGAARIEHVALEGLAVSGLGGKAGEVTSFRVDADGDGPTIPAALFGTNVEWIREGNGLWNTARGQLDADIIAMSKRAGIRVVRFPGGVWSDTYDWRDGVGPQDSRPTTRHIPDQAETSRHYIGTPEVVAFAESIGAELLITVNAGHGSPEDAAAWAAHIRDVHGAGVAPVWEIGNELYMENDLSGGSTTPEAYAEKVRAFAAAIRAELPDAKIAAIGLLNYGPYRFNAHANWNEVVLERTGDVIDIFAIHNAYAPLVIESSPRRWAEVYRAMLAAPVSIARNLADTAALIDARAPEAMRGRIPIAVTEWGPWFSADPANPYFDHTKTLGSAVFVARALNVFIRDPRVESAQFFKLSDWINIGWIGPARGGGWRETPALLALGLYRDAPNATLLSLVRESGPNFSSSQLGFQPSVDDAPLVDAVAFRSDDGRVTLIASNADLTYPQSVRIAIAGAVMNHDVAVSTLSGPVAVAHRDTVHIDVPGVPFAPPATFAEGGWFAGSSAETVTIVPGSAEWRDGELMFDVPPASLVAITLTPQ
jgi:alpha-N-arabinofuranosidase